MEPIAAAHGLYVCRVCSLLSRSAGMEARCPRCGAGLHFRKPHSLARTWALLVAAVILYIPANVLPVTRARWLGGAQDDTILSGVLYLWASGSWPIALLVFAASICVPLLKMVALGHLAVSVQFGSSWQPRSLARLYRVVDVIGRWSMLDIFVIGILVALVQAKGLATIDAGPGAIAFAAVVVLTLLAAKSFDPRLIWDASRHGSR
jgi:paraquat-inducible protein A